VPNTTNQQDAFYELAHFIVEPRTVRLLSEQYCRQNYVALLRRRDTSQGVPIVLGMLEPKNAGDMLQTVSQRVGQQIEAVQLNAYEITKAIDIGYAVARVKKRSELKLRLRPIMKKNFDPDSSPDQLLTDMLGHAIAQGASDVHIEAYEDDVDVRYRIDGVLHQRITPLDIDRLPNVISRLKILSDLDIADRRIAQEGRIYANYSHDGGERSVDVRISILPGVFGEDAVLRILDSEKPLVGLDRLGFVPEVLESFRELCQNPEGLIIVTGPTGSGKTTTLYSALNEIRNESRKVLSVEDPIETFLPKTNQKQVSASMGFADYLRAFLRQDPDVIMVGEIRDQDTAETAIRAAQTGHLVLSTLLANHIVGIIERLRMLNLSEKTIGDSIVGSLAQRLVRRICKHCKEEAEPSEFAKEVFQRVGSTFQLYHGTGCDACHGTGYLRRIGLYELFVNRSEISDSIANGEPNYKIRQRARSLGMRTLFEDGLIKAKAGVTTLDEIKRVVGYRLIRETLDAK
jgi:type II secretory ATPase GspE/PulE/Tfp pilus assembly ATPase PilB-like protein